MIESWCQRCSKLWISISLEKNQYRPDHFLKVFGNLVYLLMISPSCAVFWLLVTAGLVLAEKKIRLLEYPWLFENNWNQMKINCIFMLSGWKYVLFEVFIHLLDFLTLTSTLKFVITYVKHRLKIKNSVFSIFCHLPK